MEPRDESEHPSTLDMITDLWSSAGISYQDDTKRVNQDREQLVMVLIFERLMNYKSIPKVIEWLETRPEVLAALLEGQNSFTTLVPDIRHLTIPSDYGSPSLVSAPQSSWRTDRYSTSGEKVRTIRLYLKSEQDEYKSVQDDYKLALRPRDKRV